jgi:hypothetical protein
MGATPHGTTNSSRRDGRVMTGERVIVNVTCLDGMFCSTRASLRQDRFTGRQGRARTSLMAAAPVSSSPAAPLPACRRPQLRPAARPSRPRPPPCAPQGPGTRPPPGRPPAHRPGPGRTGQGARPPAPAVWRMGWANVCQKPNLSHAFMAWALSSGCAQGLGQGTSDEKVDAPSRWWGRAGVDHFASVPPLTLGRCH